MTRTPPNRERLVPGLKRRAEEALDRTRDGASGLLVSVQESRDTTVRDAELGGEISVRPPAPSELRPYERKRRRGRGAEVLPASRLIQHDARVWCHTEPVSSGTSDAGASELVPFGTMSSQDAEKPTHFGERLIAAAEAEGTTVTRLGRESAFGPTLWRYVYGTRGGDTFEAMQRLYDLARKLHVNFEWLVFGEGPMRRDGRGSTPAEEAIVFARKNGAREDAIQAAWTEHQENETTWTVWEWVEAIDAKVRHLERTGVPRPEKIAAKQHAIVRTAKKRAKQRGATVLTTEPTKRVASGGEK